MDIKDRIKLILDREELSQVDFSSKTSIKPATLNHVLTGRNNASREVIEKILNAFPCYNEDWLVLGQGAMLTDSARQKIQEEVKQPLFPDYPAKGDEQNGNNVKQLSEREFSSVRSRIYADAPISTVVQQTNRKIAKIIVYYTDNTFETLIPSE